MAYVSVARRKTLARKHQLGCPRQLLYPLNSRAHVIAAAQRYRQKKTTKCTGGAKRICNAARRYGIDSELCHR